MTVSFHTKVRSTTDDVAEHDIELRQEGSRVGFAMGFDGSDEVPSETVEGVVGERIWPLVSSSRRGVVACRSRGGVRYALALSFVPLAGDPWQRARPLLFGRHL